jgi:hypothetical protein
MPSWSEIAFEEPDLARIARGYFDAHTHKLLATLRRDGSPRISGIEATFADGELWLGMMPRSVKALDLLRDPRFALHSGSDDPPGWTGDAKVAGRAEEVTDDRRSLVVGDDSEAHVFRCELEELVVVRLSETRDRLVIESWHPGRGIEHRER